MWLHRAAPAPVFRCERSLGLWPLHPSGSPAELAQRLSGRQLPPRQHCDPRGGLHRRAQAAGYDVTASAAPSPPHSSTKASSLGLRSGISASQGSVLTLAEGAQLVYNALTASTSDGQVYGSTIGFNVTDGQVDVSSIVMDSVEGPFVVGANTVLPSSPPPSTATAPSFRRPTSPPTMSTTTVRAPAPSGSTPAKPLAASRPSPPRPAFPRL